MKTIGEEVYNHTVQYKMECFTKHVNNMLRVSPLIKNWAFYVTDGCMIVVMIDYIHDLHSRNMFDILNNDIDEPRLQFDHYLRIHFEELREKINAGVSGDALI